MSDFAHGYFQKHTFLSKRLILIFAFAFLSWSVVNASTSNKPKLIVGIVVEQFKYEYLALYDSLLRDDGIKKMMANGVNCTNVHHNSFFTQSAADLATIATGTYPQNHGIVSNKWYNHLLDKYVYAASDDNANSVGGYSFEAGKISPRNLYTTTFGDELNRANQFKSKIVSIAMDASAAVFSVGHTAKDVYWYDNASGEWITSTYYKNSIDAWLQSFNKRKLADYYLESTWSPKFPISRYKNCMPNNSPYGTGINNFKSFPYDYKEISKIKSGNILNINTKSEKDYSILRISPMGSSMIREVATTAIIGLQLGKDDYTDYLSLTFSSIKEIGQKFGPSSIELADAVSRLDDEIASLLKTVEDNVGKDYLVFFTSNSGSAELPEYLNSMNLPGGVFSGASTISILRSYLNAIYGDGDWVKEYNQQQIYLNHSLIESKKLNLNEVQKTVAQFMLDCSGVSNAFTANDVSNSSHGNQLLSRLLNGYHPKRSGDVIISFLPGWVEKDIDGNVLSNSIYEYDTHIPLIWYGMGINHKKVSDEIEPIDIAATLSQIMDISAPNACTGKSIDDVINN